MISNQMSDNNEKKQYSDPVYKTLAKINGRVNVMTKTQLVEQLQSFNLNIGGVKNVLKKRLKAYYKRALVQTPKGQKDGESEPLYDFLLVIDFEATCEANHTNYPHEIIEFPAVLIDVSKQEIVDEFHSYVRPCLNKKLTDFCIQLTGITQDMVDSSPTFPEVLQMFEEWLVAHKLHRKGKFAVVTDGPWDMSRFMYLQCHVSRLPLPKWSLSWVNIRKSYCNAYDQPKASLKSMLEGLSMEFEGRAHSGISDSRNIARILVQMIRDGCSIFINERMFADKVTETRKVSSNEKRYKAVPRQRYRASAELKDSLKGDFSDEEEEDKEDQSATKHLDRQAIKSSAKEEKLRQLQDDLESCGDLLYYMSLKKS